MSALEKLKNVTVYKIKSAQSIKRLSEYFELPPRVIYAYNAHLEQESGDVCNALNVGQIVVIPTFLTLKKRYTVLPCESLSDVCKKFCVPRELFISENKADYVYAGMQVFI